MYSVQKSRLMKLALVAAIILGVMVVGLAGKSSRALAQDTQHQTYYIRAGGQAAGNIDILAFGPSELKVHQGDTVTWLMDGFHNVHFEDQMANLIIVDDKGNPIINPDIANPTGKSGDNFVNGANSGMPTLTNASLTFSQVMDVAPGRYTYFCDIHPGMVGVIEVVADDVSIPSPDEAALAGRQELGAYIDKATPASLNLSIAPMATATDGKVAVAAGNGDTGRATVNLFAPSTVTIKAGESVVWTVPADSVEVHFINSLPFDPNAFQDFIPVLVSGSTMPTLNVGPGFLGTSQDGDKVGKNGSFNSGFLAPGQSFTLTFTDPGVYPYFCHIHPGMNGVVVVDPAA